MPHRFAGSASALDKLACIIAMAAQSRSEMTAMASTMFDSVLYRDVFSTPAMRAVFSDDAVLKAYVQAEVALAAAQGETGVIPREAAEAIARHAPAVVLDRGQLKIDTENVG
jgi:3-carboxy-cis,cis-muconate cycloisomerase